MSTGHVNVNTQRGLKIFRSLDLDESEEAVKATEGVVFHIHVYNAHATDARFLKLYNATTTGTTVGTTTPVATYHVPAVSSFTMDIDAGLHFDTAITAAATTAIADADTGAPAANDVSVVIGYA
jgi:hypothetical protein